MTLLLVSVCGGAGAVLRWLGSGRPSARWGRLPGGVWSVNVLGSALLGLLSAWAAHGQLSTRALVILGSGFCGGFTTFSAASLDVAVAWRDRRPWTLLGRALVMALGCLAAALLGLAAGGWRG